jgi:hypothetical protein
MSPWRASPTQPTITPSSSSAHEAIEQEGYIPQAPEPAQDPPIPKNLLPTESSTALSHLRDRPIREIKPAPSPLLQRLQEKEWSSPEAYEKHLRRFYEEYIQGSTHSDDRGLGKQINSRSTLLDVIDYLSKPLKETEGAQNIEREDEYENFRARVRFLNLELDERLDKKSKALIARSSQHDEETMDTSDQRAKTPAPQNAYRKWRSRRKSRQESERKMKTYRGPMVKGKPIHFPHLETRSLPLDPHEQALHDSNLRSASGYFPTGYSSTNQLTTSTSNTSSESGEQSPSESNLDSETVYVERFPGCVGIWEKLESGEYDFKTSRIWFVARSICWIGRGW